MADNLEIFRNEFLNANTWAQRKDGVPLFILDKLSSEELKTAETELIKAVNTGDTWIITGLGHIKSKDSLPVLYRLLPKTKKNIKVTIACSIYKICQDRNMIDIVLEETPRIISQIELIDLLYLLPELKDKRVTEMLNNFRNHREYLIAYNATRALGLPTDEVVEKFRNKKSVIN